MMFGKARNSSGANSRSQSHHLVHETLVSPPQTWLLEIERGVDTSMMVSDELSLTAQRVAKPNVCIRQAAGEYLAGICHQHAGPQHDSRKVM